MKRHEQVFKRTLKHKKQHKSMKKLSYVMQKQAKAYKTLQSMHKNEKGIQRYAKEFDNTEI